jgi:hypothetical protein
LCGFTDEKSSNENAKYADTKDQCLFVGNKNIAIYVHILSYDLRNKINIYFSYGGSLLRMAHVFQLLIHSK